GRRSSQINPAKIARLSIEIQSRLRSRIQIRHSGTFSDHHSHANTNGPAAIMISAAIAAGPATVRCGATIQKAVSQPPNIMISAGTLTHNRPTEMSRAIAWSGDNLAQPARLLERLAEILGHCFVSDRAFVNVEAVGEMRIVLQRFLVALVGQRQSERQRRVVE